MSKLGSLYTKLGEPEGELSGCTCEVGDWAAAEIERLRSALIDANYLARCSERLMAAINLTDEAHTEHGQESAGAADEARSEAWRALNLALYQYRKRARHALGRE